MSSWEPVDIDHDDTVDVEWDDDVLNDLESRFDELKQLDKKFNDRRYKDVRDETLMHIDSTRHDIEELVANQIYDTLTTNINNIRKKYGIQNSIPIDPHRRYDNFKLADDGALTYIYKKTVIYLGNINEKLKPPSEIRRLGVKKLKLMGFMNITDEEVQPSKKVHVKKRDKLRKLDENLDERSKAIESSSTTDTEAIEMTEVTFKDVDTAVKDVEQDTSFIEPSERDKLLPLRELEGLDKQLRMIKGSLNASIAKHIDLKNHIEHEERKLNEIQDPSYSDDQRNMIEIE